MNICILGRQPELGIAELESLYGATVVQPIGDNGALVDAPLDFARLGGSVKAAELLATIPGNNLTSSWKQIAKLLPKLVRSLPPEGKIKLGLSVYGATITPYALGGAALRFKKIIRTSTGRSVRVVPNDTPALSSAQTYHNKLAGELGLEFVVLCDADTMYIGRVTDVQNIDSYRIRDRDRPKRDAFVGMLPPKLAQMIVNLATAAPSSLSLSDEPGSERGKILERRGLSEAKSSSAGAQELFERATLREEVSESEEGAVANNNIEILDPFCGTGVVLQEAMLMGYDAYGSDISPKMIDFTNANLDWLTSNKSLKNHYRTETADACNHNWRLDKNKTTIVACEGYLGQPLGGQNPSAEQLAKIVHETNRTMQGFLKNIAPQLASGTRLCIAMPVWFALGSTHHLPVTLELEKLGFTRRQFTHASGPLLYHREDQVTGRELVVLERT